MSQYFPKSYEPFGGDINVKFDLSNYETKTDLKNVTYVDVSSFALKSNLAYDTDKSDLEKKISDADKKILDTSDLAKKTDLNSKITEIEGKISSITGLAPNSALTAVENKIPDVSSLVEKTIYNTKISEIEKEVSNHNHEKYITTPEFNNLAAGAFTARLARASLVTKTKS